MVRGRRRGSAAVELLSVIALVGLVGAVGLATLGPRAADAIGGGGEGARRRAQAQVVTSRAAALSSAAAELAEATRVLLNPSKAFINDLASETRFALGPRGPGYALLPTESVLTEGVGRALMEAQRADYPSGGWGRNPRSLNTSLAEDLADNGPGLHDSVRFFRAHLQWTHRWMNAAFGNRLAPYRSWYPDDFDQLVNFTFRGGEETYWHVDTLAVNAVATLVGSGTQVLPHWPSALPRPTEWHSGFTPVSPQAMAPHLGDVISAPRGQTLVLPGSHADMTIRYRGGGGPEPRIHSVAEGDMERLVLINPFVPKAPKPRLQ